MKTSNSVVSSGTGDVEFKSQWNLFWWILGTIFIPITIPYTVLKIIGNLKQKRHKGALPGKVINIFASILSIFINLYICFRLSL